MTGKTMLSLAWIKTQEQFSHLAPEPSDFNSPRSVVYGECHKQSLCASHTEKEPLITAGRIPGIQLANQQFLTCYNSIQIQENELGLLCQLSRL